MRSVVSKPIIGSLMMAVLFSIISSIIDHRVNGRVHPFVLYAHLRYILAETPTPNAKQTCKIKETMGPQRVEQWIMKSRSALRIRMGFYGLAMSLLRDKSGLEIGGPSDTFRRGKSLLPVYSTIRGLDNCDISSSTVWASHSEEFSFDEEKLPGKNIFCDGSHLSSLADGTYDFVLSCHNLEHFANPVKALKEWQRVMVKKGILVIVLPYYRYTFDHRRKPTPVSHMIADFENDTPETDLSHLPEILENHDLSLDIPAASPEEFHKRSLANYENRCLHHHVFDTRNIRDLLTALGIRVLSVQSVWPNNIFIVAESQ